MFLKYVYTKMYSIYISPGHHFKCYYTAVLQKSVVALQAS